MKSPWICFLIVAVRGMTFSELKCPEPDAISSFREERMAWVCDVIDWRRSLTKWRELIERDCVINDVEESWRSFFQCADFSNVTCLESSARDQVDVSSKCSIAFCTDGKYSLSGWNAFREIWRKYLYFHKRIMSLIKLVQCSQRGCAESTSSNPTVGMSTYRSATMSESLNNPTEEYWTTEPTSAFYGTRIATDASTEEGPAVSTGVNSEYTSDESATVSAASDPGFLDVIFVLDGSNSVGEKNFQAVKEWTINQTVTIYRQFGTRAIVGVVQYSNKDPDFLRISVEDSQRFVVPLKLAENVTVEDSVRSRISNMIYLSENTYTAFGLTRAATVEFPQSLRYPEATRIIVLLTDGPANDGPELYNWWQRHGSTGEIIPFAVGVADYRLSDLRMIANGGRNDTRVFTLDTFEMLSMLNIVDQIAKYVS